MRPDAHTPPAFAARLLAWHDLHGRHDLPWQHPRDAYRVWISEVMLQQTQVSTVIGYFQRFIDRFPDLPSLAAAPLDAVLAVWSGLGYYSRARNLHAAARQMLAVHQGVVPDSMDALQALPGIGRSTAAAILAQAYGQRAAILDGNVRRVLARQTGETEWPGSPQVQQRLWHSAEARLPHARLADYTQALMDLGALLCTARQPKCSICPVQSGCVAASMRSTERIPAPRPRRAQPLRLRHWLCLTDAGGRILLEQRPPAGIWGGLLSLPEADTLDALLTRFQVAAEYLLPAGTVRHTFTHFRLQASVWRCAPAGHALSLAVNPVGLCWLSVDEALQAGIAAPLRRWLQASGTGTSAP